MGGSLLFCEYTFIIVQVSQRMLRLREVGVEGLDIKQLSLAVDESRPPQPDIDLPGVATLTIGEHTFQCSVDDLDVVYELGTGAYGRVDCMKHSSTDVLMAVKKIRTTSDQAENKRMLRECRVGSGSLPCPYTITFYGAMFREGFVWICMELMHKSLEKVCYLVYDKLDESIPELVVGKMAEATLKALYFLYTDLKVMHRDIKPSNILINLQGEIKLCDFGIAGELVNSLALTDIGCKPYLAPERIDGGINSEDGGYDHRSDVWSLGITLYEVAVGKFPYPPCRNMYQRISAVKFEPPPTLPTDRHFQTDFNNFVTSCLTKNYHDRPKYGALISHDYIKRIESQSINIGEWYQDVLERKPSESTNHVHDTT